MAEFGICIAEKLIEAIGSEIIQKICDMRNYKSELEGLDKTVKFIKNVLHDADTNKRDLTREEQAYIDELMAAVYDADDLFDEFLTLAELNQLNDKKEKNILKKVRDFFSSKKKGVTQAHRMSNLVIETKRQLDSIASNHKKFKLELDAKPTRQKSRETSSYLHKNVIMGRERDQKNVIDMLMSPDIKNDVSFLTIVGVGGLGKTTLAQLVYHDEMVQKEFAIRLWVSVSDHDGQKFNLQDILCRILEVYLHVRQFDDTCSLELVQTKFKESLGGKKYLIVLDDVWNEDATKWCILQNLLELGQRGSRILITSRSKRTSNIIGNFVYELEGLSEEHSWDLFEMLAFDKGEEHVDYYKFVELGKKIVKKCHNVPFAIQVVGSLLCGQKLSRWRSLEESGMNEICELEGNNQIMSILKLSYNNLDISSKRCFSYCALFPRVLR